MFTINPETLKRVAWITFAAVALGRGEAAKHSAENATYLTNKLSSFFGE